METDKPFFGGDLTFEEALMEISKFTKTFWWIFEFIELFSENPPVVIEDKEAEEEDNDLNDVVILTRSRESRTDLDAESICTMVTAVEDRYEPSIAVKELEQEEIVETGGHFEVFWNYKGT